MCPKILVKIWNPSVAAALFHADVRKLIAVLHSYLVKAPEMGLKESGAWGLDYCSSNWASAHPPCSCVVRKNWASYTIISFSRMPLFDRVNIKISDSRFHGMHYAVFHKLSIKWEYAPKTNTTNAHTRICYVCWTVHHCRNWRIRTK